MPVGYLLEDGTGRLLLEAGASGTVTQVQSGAAGASTATLLVDFDAAGIATAGNVLVARCLIAESGSSIFSAPPAGWSLAPTQPVRGQLWWKVADGGETDVTFTADTARAMRAVIYELSGADTTTPFDAFGSAEMASVNSILLETSSATTADNCWSGAGVVMNGTNGGGETWSNGFVAMTADTRTVGAAKNPHTPAGVVSTTATWTTARGGQWFIYAVKPASGGGGGGTDIYLQEQQPASLLTRPRTRKLHILGR
jgi:hypothetical protein